MKNNHRPSLARPRNPSSKLVPSSATKSTRLCRIRPEPDDRGRSSRLVNSATAPWSRGARPPRVHQHAPPRAELKKNVAAGRWNFRHVGREPHPMVPKGGRAPGAHARRAQYFKFPRIPRSYTIHSQFGQRRTHVALPLLALIHSPRKKLPSLNGCGQVNTRPF